MATEKRLIDANALITAFEKEVEQSTYSYFNLDEIVDEIIHAPTVDAVEVVRCKDCKHFGGHGACYCHAADENGTPIFVREDDFCSYGERRTNG